MEVHFDHLDHGRLYARRQERAATWDVSEFYEQSSIGATWKWTATRNNLVLLLRVNAAQQDELYQTGARYGLTLREQFLAAPHFGQLNTATTLFTAIRKRA